MSIRFMSEESSTDQYVITASDTAPAEAAHFAHARTLEQAYCFRSGHCQGSFRVRQGKLSNLGGDVVAVEG